MPSALVTGASGQDGQYMCNALLSAGYRVTGTVRPGTEPPDIRGVDFVEMDLRDDAAVARTVELAAPSEIYNLAAISSLAEAEEDPVACRDVNLGGLERLIDAAPLSTRICQATSALVFGPPNGAPRNENSPLAPTGPYAEAKAAAHRLIEDERERGRYAVSAILFNHESPLRGTRFVTRKVTLGVAEIVAGVRDVIEIGNVAAQRDWGFAGDFVRAMRLAMSATEARDYVIATGVLHSVRDLVRTAFGVAGIDDWERHIRYERDEPEPSSSGDAARAAEMLGWQSQVSFSALIEMMTRHDLQGV